MPTRITCHPERSPALFLSRRSLAGAGRSEGSAFRASAMYTQPFAFRAPLVDDESVKMSNTTTRRTSVPDDATSIVVLPALSDSCEGRPTPSLHARSAPAGAAPAMRAANGVTIAGLSTRRQHRQFLFATNEPFARVLNFVTHTKQSTSLFLFATNAQPPVITSQSRLTDHCSPAATPGFLIAGEKILKTELTPSVPIPNVFLIAGVSATRTVRAASPHAPRFSALFSAASRSSHFGLHRSPAASRAAQIAKGGSPITTHQTLTTTHEPGAQILHG
jgi:hypothetical protein